MGRREGCLEPGETRDRLPGGIRIFEGPIIESRSTRRGEERWKAIGLVDGLELAVVYTWRTSRRRIISARRAKRNERRAYRAAYPGGPGAGQD